MSKKFAQDCYDRIMDERIVAGPLGYILQTLIDALPEEPRIVATGNPPNNLQAFLGVSWCRSGDGITFRWYASFLLKDGTKFSKPLDECRYSDGSPWTILGKQEPLWEGDAWVHPKLKDGILKDPLFFPHPPSGETGWRKIKVREVRENPEK